MKDEAFLDRIINWDDYIDESLTEEECLMYQLNNDIQTSFDLNDIEFGIPEETNNVIVDIANSNRTIDTNTRILVSAKVGSEFRGKDYYHYRRIDLSTQWRILHKTNEELIIPDDTIEINDIKEYIRRKLPVRMESINITNNTRNGLRYLDITPIPNSLLYIGKLSLIRKDINSPMAKIRRSNRIRGLDYHHRKQSKKEAPGFTY